MNELIPVAFSTLASVISGLLLLIVKSRYSAQAEREKSVDEQLQRLRAKDEKLGYDIQATRNTFGYFCGKMGQEQPIYEKQNGS